MNLNTPFTPNMQSFDPPSGNAFANPPVPDLPADTPHDGRTFPQAENTTTDQMMDEEDEVNAIDTATDALLERQNVLFQDNHPLPKLPRIRGLSAKHFMGETKSNQSTRRRRGTTRRRGPRKAVEPTGDIKYRLNMASNAYMDGRIDEAIGYVEDAIRINAETYRAWTLLASFLREKKDMKGEFTAKFMAAALQPKEIDGWLQCAKLGHALTEEFPEEADEFLQQAIFSYSSALRVDSKHREARHGRAGTYFEMGRIKSAAKDYGVLVETCLYDVYALRGLVQVSVLLSGTGKPQFADKPRVAIEAYRSCIAHFRENGFDSSYPFGWDDAEAFVDLLAYAEQFEEAIREVRSLSRWLLTRDDETFWDDESDDREWDVDNTRRLEVPNYQEGKYPVSSYGIEFPIEMRTKLAVYRLRLGQEDEAMRHLELLDPYISSPDKPIKLYELLLEVATAFYEMNNLPLALRYYEPLRAPDFLDTEPLVRLGHCYLDAGDNRQAEECFTTAIDQDQSNSEACIDARYELAKMYEAAREEREAYILVNEAIRLQEAREQAGSEFSGDEDNEDDDDLATMRSRFGIGTEPKPKSKRAKRPPKPKGEKSKREPRPKGEPTRRRPKVFALNEEVQLEEKRRTNEMAEAWEVVRDSQSSAQLDDGATGPSNSFMAAAQLLVDDFRSYREFYPWDKYLAHLGIDQAREKVMSRKGNRNLLAMVERLSHNLNPEDPNTDRQPKQVAISYRNVPFDDWLDLFLEYAIGLAQTGKFQQAYKVCESARDATIFSKSKENMFLIHVSWAACALRGRDEEQCVAVARWLMREYQYDTDPFRMFSALSRLCLSPASWYASGPVQKYMLRQIKLMDRAIGAKGAREPDDSGGEEDAPTNKVYPSKKLDITLLMLYGFILFISNSFTYALNYFTRAYSLDPNNGMVLLTIGHCYVHYALKRQSENRQYLLSQGFLFLHKYYKLKQGSLDAAQRQEAHFNLARSYHAIGLTHLAAKFYQLALQEVPDDSDNGIMGRNDLTLEAAYNLQHICWTGGDIDAVKNIAEKYLVL